MAAPLRFPRWVEAIIVLVLLAPIVVAVLPLEEARFFVVSGAICIAAPLGGLWLGEAVSALCAMYVREPLCG